MHSKIKVRACGEKFAAAIVKPLLLHDVTNDAGAVRSPSRRRLFGRQPVPAKPLLNRHHVSRHTQS